MVSKFFLILIKVKLANLVMILEAGFLFAFAPDEILLQLLQHQLENFQLKSFP